MSTSLIDEAETLERHVKAGQPYNVIICCVGLGASPHDFDNFAKVVEDKFHDENYIILKSKNHMKGGAGDGIEQLATWFSEEVVEFFEKYQALIQRMDNQKHKLTIIGHSLGGLIARYAIGLLFGDEHDSDFAKLFNRKYRTHLDLVAYISICCPHLGCKRNKDGIFKFFWDKGSYSYLVFFGLTGKQMKLRDKEAPILHKMSDPKSRYMRALSLFKHRTLITIVHYDTNLSYVSGSIRSYNPYPEPKFGTADFKIAGYSNFQQKHERLFEPYLSYEEDNDIVVAPPLGQNNIVMNPDVKIDERGKTLLGGALSYNDVRDGTEFHPSNKHEPFMEEELDIMNNLHSLEWRRVDLQFRLHSGYQNGFIHGLPIGCTLGVKLGMKGPARAGDRCVDAIVNMIKLDHMY